MSVIALENGQSFYEDQVLQGPRDALSIQQVDTPPLTNSCMLCHVSGGPFAVYADPSKSFMLYPPACTTMIKWPTKGITLNKTYDKAFLPGRLNADFPQWGIDTEDASNFKDAIQSAMSAVDPSRLPTVMKSANCSKCHDGSQRNWMGPSVGVAVNAIVSSGKMPPNISLSPAESSALASTLNIVYTQKISDYMLGPLQ